MKASGQYTYHEIVSQPDSWAEALSAAQAAVPAAQRIWRAVPNAELLFTGCGSTYYLSVAAAALAAVAGLPARAVPASELWLSPRTAAPDLQRTVLVTISRSGETSETVRAVESYRAAGGAAMVTVTCYPASTLSGCADLVVAIPSAQEQSVAQTRSFASLLVAAQVLVAGLAGDGQDARRLAGLPAIGREIIATYGALAARLGGDLTIERFFFLGNGVCYGLANEAMLKMKEMSLSSSEAFHVLEFRHGPMSMVDPATLVVGLLGDAARAHEAAVLSEMHDLGAHVLALADDVDGVVFGRTHDVVRLGSGLPVAERCVLYLPVLQLLAYHRSIAKGLDPDQPRNLVAAIIL